MIAKGNLHADGLFLARYLAAASAENERIEIGELRGFLATNIYDALREAHADAELTHCQKPLFHCQVRLPKSEALSREQWFHVADRIEKKLGFEGQARAVVFHVKDGGTHMHIAWNRIDTVQELAIDPGLYKNKLKEVCRELEREMGLQRVRNEKDPAQLTKTALRNEFEESRRLKTDLKKIREGIRSAWEASDSGPSFVAALEDKNYLLARGDRRDFVVVDELGGQHALGKRITGATAPQTRARLSDLDKDALPSVEEAREIQAERLAGRVKERQSGERDALAARQEAQKLAVLEKTGGVSAELVEEPMRKLAAWHGREADRLAIKQYRERQRLGISDPERDPAAAQLALLEQFGKASLEASRTKADMEADPVLREALRDEMPTAGASRTVDDIVAAFEKRQAAKPGAKQKLEQVERAADKTLQTTAKVAGRVADTFGKVADRFMEAAADFLVGAPPPRKFKASALSGREARDAIRAEKRAQREREDALRRLSLQSDKGRDMSRVDTGEFRYLSPADLQAIKDRGEAALVLLIQQEEVERERKRERGRDL